MWLKVIQFVTFEREKNILMLEDVLGKEET